jgi:hypothetical protein
MERFGDGSSVRARTRPRYRSHRPGAPVRTRASDGEVRQGIEEPQDGAEADDGWSPDDARALAAFALSLPCDPL